MPYLIKPDGNAMYPNQNQLAYSARENRSPESHCRLLSYMPINSGGRKSNISSPYTFSIRVTGLHNTSWYWV